MLIYSPQAAESKKVPTQPLSSLLPKVFSAVLHPALPLGPNCDLQPSTNPPNLEQLQTELRDLRDQFEQMKSQHKYGFVTVISVPSSVQLACGSPI